MTVRSEGGDPKVVVPEQPPSAPAEPVTLSILGVDWPVDADATEIVIHLGRIGKLENLEDCRNCKRLSLVSNLIPRIEGLEAMDQLEELELYQNRVQRIENIGHLRNLKVLDLAFNEIRTIEGLDTLRRLEKLYLSSNKISEIANLENLQSITMLELGSNRIRVVEGIDSLTTLRELWLGRNKITSMSLPRLPNLELLSFQNNRLEVWDERLFQNCPNITGLYLGENRLPTPPPSIAKLRLECLDLGRNAVTSLTSIAKISTLNELWLNDNAVASLDEVVKLKALPHLETLYLERNPIQNDLGPGYRMRILEILPHLKQLDAITTR